MKLSITEKAQEALKKLEVANKTNLLLWYDTKGMGCAVNGLPTIRFVENIEPTYNEVDNPIYPTYVEEKHKVFFAEDLTLDFSNGLFKLKCPHEMLNGFISPSTVNDELPNQQK